MKKNIFAIACASLMLLTGCDALDLAPQDYAAAGNYWQKESDVNSFMYGLHSNFRADLSSFSPLTLGELRGQAAFDGTSSDGSSLNYATIITNALSEDNTGVTNWNGYYNRILQVNHYIKELENHCSFLSDADRAYHLGIGYGLRAYYYFVMYKTYGGVPMEIDAELLDGASINELYKARATAEETLTQIKSDVNASESNFAKAGNRTLDRTLWNVYATKLLKADVYMWSAKVNVPSESGSHTATGNADLTTAKNALEDIRDSDQFTLLSDFSSIFGYTNKRNKEVILATPFDKDEITCSNMYQFCYQSSVFDGSFYDVDGNALIDPLNIYNSAIHRIEYKEGFVKSYDMSDSRRAATFLEYYSTKDATVPHTFGSSMKKYLGHSENGSHYWDSDFILFRYADVILRLAECENGLNNPEKCAEYINDIRKRAYGANYSDDVEYTAGTYAENELAILKERDKEFVGEGTRWWDLLRLTDANKKPLAFSAEANYPRWQDEDAAPVLSAGEAHKVLWPINVGIMTNDPLIKQTVGYQTSMK